MIVDVYSLFLFKFRDDTIVFENSHLDALGQAISDELALQPDKQHKWYVFDLRVKESDLLDSITKDRLTSATLGFYHHRLICHFRVALSSTELREWRDTLQSIANDIVLTHVVPSMQSAVKKRREQIIPQGGMIEGYTTYPLIIVNEERSWALDIANNADPLFPYTDDTTSLCFEVLEPGWLSARRHMLRISIAGTTLYADQHSAWPRGDIGNGLKRDLINGIYQYYLYPAKLDDGKIGEKLLIGLWEHIVNTTGGSTAQLASARATQRGLIFTFLGVIFGVVFGILGVLVALR